MGDLLHLIFFCFWKADYWKVYLFSLTVFEIRKSMGSLSRCTRMTDPGIGTRLSPAGCSDRVGKEERLLRMEDKARVVLKWLTVFLFGYCLIGPFLPSLPPFTCLSSSISPSVLLSPLSCPPSAHGIRD